MDLIFRIVGLLPKYLADVGNFLINPSELMLKKSDGSEGRFVEALLFLAVSIVIVVLLSLSAYVGRDISAHLEYTSVGEGLELLLFAAALRVSWGIVGGKAGYKTLLIASAYPFSLGIVVISFCQLVGRGLVKVSNPATYKQMLAMIQTSSQNISIFLDNLSMQIYALIVVAGYLFVLLWYFRGWSAYRALNAQTRDRSAVAMFMTMLLSIPIEYVYKYTEAAILG